MLENRGRVFTNFISYTTLLKTRKEANVYLLLTSLFFSFFFSFFTFW